MFDFTIKNVHGLNTDDMVKLDALVSVFNYHNSNNRKKDKYYEGNLSLRNVNLGIALPENLNNLKVSCGWGGKAVDVLASRSIFDGFVGNYGNDIKELNDLLDNNNLISEYKKATRSELKHGAVFATLSADEKIGCKIRFHSCNTAAALWNGEKNRIDAGFAIIDSVKDESDFNYKPSLINLYTDDCIHVLKRVDDNWYAKSYPHRMCRPLMEAMVWNATNDKPFGRSRIKTPVRNLIDQYVRTIANASIALEFATTPQKHILGLTDEQYDQIVQNKFNHYAGSVMAATTNPETGLSPTIGQTPQGNISSHVNMLRLLATQFSAETGLSAVDVGVINDANPSSSDAILAQSQTLVLMAEELNTSNAESLKTIMLMAQAIKDSKTLDELTDEQKNIMPHFKNPAMPSVSMTADAAVKIASSRPSFSNTDAFLEMNGFSQADIRRIKNEEKRNRGALILEQEFNVDNQKEVIES